MVVLLASAPHGDTFGYSMPPPGLLRLGGALRDAGVGVRLDDLAFRLASGALRADDWLADDAAERLARAAPRVLGLSVMGATLPIALAIAERVRARLPATPIVLGGPGTTGIDRALCERFPAVDAVVRGEGERALPELAVRLASGGDAAGVRGVTWRRKDGSVAREPDRAPIADLAELPECAWDLLPSIAEYTAIAGEVEGLVPIDSGRGCVFDCSFCTIGRFWGRRSRVVPAPRLVAELLRLLDVPGARSAYLCHDLFGADRRHALALCDALIERGAPVPWECRARVDHLDPALIERMGRAGCTRVLLGVESGDADVREAHAKRLRPGTDVLATVERLAAARITPILSMIVGLPGEDDAALERTLALALDASLAAGCNLSFHLVNPQPGCALGEAEAARSRPLEGVPPDMALGAGQTAPERALIAAHPDLFSTFAVLTAAPGGARRLRALHRLAAGLPALLMARPRAFALVLRRLELAPSALFARVTAAGAPPGEDVERFDALALALGDPLVDDVLAWERAIAAADETPRVVRVRHDLPALAALLRARAADPRPAPAPAALAVVRGARGVRTVRVSADVARWIEAPLHALDPDQKAFLRERGLAPHAEPAPARSP